MGSNKNTVTFPLVTGQNIGTSSTSGSTGIQYLDNVGVFLTWTAGAAVSGTFTINVSNDGSTYSPLTLSGTPTVSGSADTAIISINQCPFRFFTITYTSGTTGTGAWNALITAKELG